MLDDIKKTLWAPHGLKSVKYISDIFNARRAELTCRSAVRAYAHLAFLLAGTLLADPSVV